MRPEAGTVRPEAAVTRRRHSSRLAMRERMYDEGLGALYECIRRTGLRMEKLVVHGGRPLVISDLIVPYLCLQASCIIVTVK